MNSCIDKITRVARNGALALLVVFALGGCGGGGGGGGSGTQPTTPSPTTNQAGIVVSTLNDASVPIIAVATDKNWRERITLVGNKDAAGNPVSLSKLYYSVLGTNVTIELNADGLPALVSDQSGNKYTLTNYTSSTVDITFFDQVGGRIVGPTSISVDSAKLASLKNASMSMQQNKIQAGLSLEPKNWLPIAGLAVDVGLCGAEIVSTVTAAAGTVGVTAPAILWAAYDCGSTAIYGYQLFKEIEDPKTTLTLASTDLISLGINVATLDPKSVTDVVKVGSGLAAWMASNTGGKAVADAAAALGKDAATPKPPANLTLTPRQSSIQIRWVGSATDFGIKEYRIIRNGYVTFTSPTAFYEDNNIISGISYCYQVVAVGVYESDKSVSQCATIPAGTPPLAITGTATNITPSLVTLNGSVNPNGAITNTHFEYGASTAYGSQTQVVQVGNGTGTINLTEKLSSLVPNTTYHYRVVATNSEGSTTYGSDQTFRSVAPVTPAPTVSSVSTVTGSDSAQPFTINGSHFVTGANVTLRNKSTGEIFPNRQSTSFSSTSITLSPVFTSTPGTWSVNIVNPDNSSTGEYVFSVVAPTGSPLSFTSLSPSVVAANSTGYQPTLTASGSNFNNVKQISFDWTGVTSGNSTWIKGDTNWLLKASVNSDGSMALKPVVTQTGDPAGITTWTVTLTDTVGITARKTFTVNYTPSTSVACTAPQVLQNGVCATPTAATNGACGSSNGLAVSSAPSTSLCSTGMASTVTGSGPWNWSCSGSNGGTNASCSATSAPASVPTSVNLSNLAPVWDAASPAGPAVTLNWTASGATSYEVYRNGVKIYPSSGTYTGTTLYNNAGLTSGLTYSYYILAKNAAGSTQSNTINVGPMPSAPALAPSISSLSTNSLNGACSAQQLTIYGSNFVSGATVNLYDQTNGVPYPNRATTFNTSGQLTLFATYGGSAANWSVTVVNPNGSSSSSANFSVIGPSITGVSPNPVPRINGAQTITFFGSDFLSGAAVQIDDGTGPYAKTPTVLSSGQLTISAYLTSAPATWKASIRNCPSLGDTWSPWFNF